MREMKRMRMEDTPGRADDAPRTLSSPTVTPSRADDAPGTLSSPTVTPGRADDAPGTLSSPTATPVTPGRADDAPGTLSSPTAMPVTPGRADDAPGTLSSPTATTEPQDVEPVSSQTSVTMVPPSLPGPSGLSQVSPQSLAWKRKRSSREIAQHMRECQHPNYDLDNEPVSDHDGSDQSSSDEEFDAQEAVDDWVLGLRLEQRRMLAVTLMESFKTRQKMNVKEAATEAGSIVGFNEKSVRKYRNDFFANKGTLTPHKQGKYERHCVHNDEHLNHTAAEWVRANAFVKGQPNMTAQSFCDWVNSELLISSHLPPFFPREISMRTAVRWLHHLGFKPVSHKKGVYIDGHEREDVVKHRKDLLKVFHDLRSSHRPLPPCSDEPPRVRLEDDNDKKELVLIYHDESIFNTNEGQTWMWGESERPAILPKTKGSGIMVSDFVEEHGGYLKLSPVELVQAKRTYPNIQPAARRLLEYGAEREGYWTSDRFMEQINNAADIADIKYGATHTIVWLFDQSSCHKKYDNHALQASKILVKDGGLRRVRDTVWGGKPQSMVNPDGTAKGLRTILRERGINTANMKADDMRTVLSFHDDFLNENTIVEHYLKGRGHKAYFLPKFHCELNAIERVWAQAKVYCRAYTNFTLIRLRQIIDPALDSVTVDNIRKFSRKSRDYERAYREGHKAGKAVENAVKKYKSHRRVFS